MKQNENKKYKSRENRGEKCNGNTIPQERGDERR
jgi:hypothetical protein